jgi:hypothetical protein
MAAGVSLFSQIPWISVLHLISYAYWFGTVQWVTWIGGIVMLKNMPRHMFGNVQSKLFPWYFATGTVANLILMYSFYIQYPRAFTFDFSHMWNNEQGFQVFILEISLICNLLSMFYLGPKTSSVMFERHKLEKEAQSDTRDAKLKAVNSKFGMLHGISSLVNLTVVGALILHGIYLAKRLSL